MREQMYIGSAPPMEDCAQVGSPDYHERARKECRAYIEVLRRKLGEEPEGAHLTVQSHPHDFGDYLAVVCRYDPEQPAAIDYAFKCESDGPDEWDDIARAELNLKGDA